MIQECEVCKQPYVLKRKDWHKDYVPKVCSGKCLVHVLTESLTVVNHPVLSETVELFDER